MEKINHYYGSRVPKQSAIETDRILFQMIDDMNVNNTLILTKEDEEKQATPTKEKDHGSIWRFRIILSSIIILLLVIATIVVSEVTKNSTN